ncbi:agmatine deiminase family protein [Kushneria indalinina]|uniref:Agmatine deiminase n=1 Tax=Kushneria indalinina DSM 14324 TaxID=1122140 RepID=A0A3D9DZ40_9GAMM|nr:agmatine deiminase family protein [Kushneria indalinina]REC96057.1 agmatine deiminase [Kushneria indalinina DSM 14324]
MNQGPSSRQFLPEWTPQQAVLLSWPGRDSDWASLLDAIETTFITLIEVIARYQHVLVTLPDDDTRQRLATTLTNLGVPDSRLSLVMAPSDDTWARDHGPLTVMDNATLRLLDYRFTGWGGKFPAERDNALNGVLAEQEIFAPELQDMQHLVLEGGGVETDGQGTLLTTRSCLLNPNRNPHLEQADVETHLRENLGIDRVLWLENGYLEGDDTDSHIDTLARFCDEQTIAYVRCDDPLDPHFEALSAMEQELKAFRRVDGQPYRLIALPWPAPCFDPEDGHRLPATYANFLIINGAVLMPAYADPADYAALKALSEAFPERDIIPIDCRQVIRQHGSLHCLTMQLPAGSLKAIEN